ncbi:hypothetical protein FHR83_000366 [Actinoplanes campanulatus]|uniref:Uncharacterized protein n=1 Tax=Actinoplanes campanulatus TaxID=113559 RepID=A0A7W5AAJ9_9ACTN|nr:hypothetical protein [Actinoplanes campanulatus]MBB3092732.1 hypothetical protein [Actinoplanes campanulatus]GGM98621.1 hypothetical protein GCM10010109_02950 [Actinoplanes campanulatus]GID34170.1 hypothetical protein Aca09nite_06760 [Actinoplanes campanulatus]
MSEQAQGRFWSGIDIPKTVAGTLAAVSAAVAGSFLGLAGTLIGAAVASLISSIATEIYHRFIDRGTRRLQTAFTVAPAAVGTPDVPATDEAPSGENDRRVHWKRVGLAAAAFFVLGMGTLTTAELFAGRSAADVTNGRDTGSPTILFQSVSEDSGEKPSGVTPSAEPTAPATGETGPSAPAQSSPAETAEPTATSEPTVTEEPKLSETAGIDSIEKSVE